MNILHISRTMGQGGAEKVVYQLCKNTDVANHFVASCGGKYVDELEKIGVQHITIPDIDKKNPILMVRTVLILLRIIKKNRINIVHSHHRMAAFYAKIIQIYNRRLKHVYTAHNVFYGKKKFMRFALNNATIVACGGTVKKNLIDEYSIPEERIAVIYNSIEKTPIKEVKIESLNKVEQQGAYLIGSIGRITEQKGFDVFVKAIALAKKEKPNIVGVIIGDGQDREKTEQIVKNLGIESSFLFLGYQKDVLSIISRMQFIVLASRWEGFPLTPIETFSVGKTIIVSNIPNNLEIVKNNVNGLSFIMNDEQDLSGKIIELANNRSLKNRLEYNAEQTYNSEFSYAVFQSRYREIWKTI